LFWGDEEPWRTLKNHWHIPATLLAGLLAFSPSLASSQTSSKRARATFDRAVAERAALTAKPAVERTRADYEKVILDFRAVYRLDPSYGKTPLALENVAELYREMGRRFADDKSFRTSIGAYQFLIAQYPASPLSPDAELSIGDVYFTDLHDTADARAAYESFLKTYRHSEKAVYARDQLKMLDAAASSTTTEKVVSETLGPETSPTASAGEEPKPGGLAMVTSVRRWVGPNYTRIVINVNGEVQFDARRLVSPDRLVFDLENARPDTSLVGKPLTVEDGFLKQIRVALYRPNVTRVVLDVERIQDYSVFSLPNPFRLVIDVHGPPREEPKTAKSIATPAAPATTKGTKPPTSEVRPSAKTSESGTVAAQPEPIRPSAPTEAGSRTLTRALGLKIGRIVIDPGHGGHDTGTIGPTGVMEKDVVLDVALRLAKLLERETGNEPILTRKDDTFIPLEERTAIANQKGADLFISIHANASRDRSARGLETYYLNFTSDPGALEVAARENATSQESVHQLQDLVKKIVLTEKIQESHDFASIVETHMHTGLAKDGVRLHDRGVKKAPFVVLIGANMPSILSEISFLSNPTDERLLKRSAYRQKIAEALYSGILQYAEDLGGVKLAEQSRTTGTSSEFHSASPSLP
jgi:N-acetylmuramoyl-L-alanine amidase